MTPWALAMPCRPFGISRQAYSIRYRRHQAEAAYSAPPYAAL
ncbi:hypothetical protein OG779_42085 [Streptomyces sp. NBC_01563]